MQIKLIAALSVSLAFTLATARAVPPGGSSAGPNDFDRFRSASSPDGKNSSNYFDRALRKATAGDFAGAIADYSAAIAVNPKSVGSHFNRGLLYYGFGRFRESILDFDAVLRNEPSEYRAYFHRAAAHAKLGQTKAALADYENALRAAPNTADADVIRARTFTAKGDYANAVSYFDKATRRSPRDPYVLDKAAWFKATCPNGSVRNGQEAVQLSTQACELSKWKNGDQIDTLAAAYAEMGDFNQAIKFQRQALALRPLAEPDSLPHMQRRLRSYQARKPFRDKPEPL